VEPVETTQTGSYHRRRRFWRWRAWRQKNPLRRGLAPVERLATLTVAVVGVALVCLTLLAGNRAFVATQRTARNTHVVNAVVTSSDAANPVRLQPEVGPGTFITHLRWHWHGTPQSTDMLVLTPPPNGSVLPLRVNDAGRPVDDPLSSPDPVPAAIETTLSGLLITAVILFAAIAALRRWLFRRRAARWQWEWEHVAARWCGRG
jgi:hypothetical protein